jgi:hypothetical protein
MCPRCGGSSCNRCLDGACVTCDGSGEVEDSPLRRARRRIKELEAELEPATPPAWRPIETAPRDGTEIFAWCPDVGIRVLIWFGGTWALSGTEDEGRGASCFDGYKPTHWLPLSALPAVPR